MKAHNDFSDTIVSTKAAETKEAATIVEKHKKERKPRGKYSRILKDVAQEVRKRKEAAATYYWRISA